MQTSSLIIITLCVAATLTLSAVTKKIIKHYDSDILNDAFLAPFNHDPKGAGE